MEYVWDDLREKHFHNRVFESINALANHLEAAAMRALENDPERLLSIVSWLRVKYVLIN
jgi:hypothetical protein